MHKNTARGVLAALSLANFGGLALFLRYLRTEPTLVFADTPAQAEAEAKAVTRRVFKRALPLVALGVASTAVSPALGRAAHPA